LKGTASALRKQGLIVLAKTFYERSEQYTGLQGLVVPPDILRTTFAIVQGLTFTVLESASV